MIFQHLNGLGMRQRCRVSTGNTRGTDIAELLEGLVKVLQGLHGEAKPLRLQVTFAKTKAEVYLETY